jgi:hypothetical protein
MKPRTTKQEWEVVQQTNALSFYYFETKVRMHKAAMRLDRRRQPWEYVR